MTGEPQVGSEPTNDPQSRICSKCADEHIIVVSRQGREFKLEPCPDCAFDHFVTYKVKDGKTAEVGKGEE